MNRKTRFLRSVASGYGATAGIAVCSLAGVYLALRFLSVAEYGMWALVLQIHTYLLLVDFGVSNAIGRFLMDFKDQRPSPDYGKMFFAGLLLSSAQAGLLFLVACGVAVYGPNFFRLSQPLGETFSFLVIGLALLGFLSMPSRVFTYCLSAYGRFDWINLAGFTGQVSFLGGFAFALSKGWGIKSYLVGAFLDIFAVLLVNLFANRKLSLAPIGTEWRLPSGQDFKRILKYGRDMFMVLIGQRILHGTQGVILGRFGSLEAVAIWSVGSKLFLFLRDLGNQVAQASGPLLIELYQQGNPARAVQSLQSLALAGGTLASVFASALMIWNRDFIRVWTQGKISWNPENDFLLGCLLVLLALAPVFLHVTGMTKNLRWLRWTSLGEGLLFILIACPAVAHFGVTGLIWALLGASVGGAGLFIFLILKDFNEAHGTAAGLDFSVALRWGAFLLSVYSLTLLFAGPSSLGELLGLSALATGLAFLFFFPLLCRFPAIETCFLFFSRLITAYVPWFRNFRKTLGRLFFV